MQCPVCIEMPTDGMRVEGNEHDAVQLTWKQWQVRK